MARLGFATSGKTLGLPEGLAGLSASDLAYIVRRAALTAVAIGALVAGLTATSAAIQGVADSGVISDDPGGRVGEVSPTGYAWLVGIRPDQQVVELRASNEPGGWWMRTTDGIEFFEASGPAFDYALRQTLPIGLLGLGFAYLAVLFLRTRRSWVLPAAAVALLTASVPLWVAGYPDSSTAVMAAAAAVPLAWVCCRLPGGIRIRAVALLGVGVLIAVWAAARLGADPAYPDLEDARKSIAVWGAVGLVVARIAIPALAGERIRMMRPRLFEVAIVAAFSVLALILLNPLRADPMVVVGVLLAAVVLLPATRRQLGRGVEAALLGDVREAAAVQAAEEERARLARELHDVPLQELVAVIRRLEILPGAEAESEDLRALAGHLRNVATELRPPVLDDLGLPAALDYLAEESTSETLPVVADLRDRTGFGAERRPPADVELAMFRIAGEAVGNAIRHSGGSRISIQGSIAPDRVEVVVVDDGAGLEPDASHEAAKRKRLGLVSMRRRAQAIDAELSIDGSSSGTRVRAVWQA